MPAGSRLKPKNIILIGFMASGKSSVGKLLAKHLGWGFMDTDSEIERITGLTIPEIFKEYGEARFRAEENLAVNHLSRITETVIATGGGTVLNQENWRILEEIGLIVYLYTPLTIALQRAKNHLSERPLITNSSTEQLEKIWEQREKIYQKATLVVDTSIKDVREITEEILKYVNTSSVI